MPESDASLMKLADMTKKSILTTATLTAFAVISGCCCVETTDCCPSLGGCGTEFTGPVLAEPIPVSSETLSEPVAAPTEAESAQWPGNDRGLIFAWRDGDASQLQRKGKAKIDRHGHMQLANGAYLPQGLNARLLEACSRSDELSIEITLLSKTASQSGPARIVSFSKDAHFRNFTLGQDGTNLVWRLRTAKNDKNGTNPEVRLAKITHGKPMHVVVSYRPGKLVCFVNGRQVSVANLQGDFHNWEPMHLIFGDEVTGDRDWNGSIERLAIRSRFIDDDEASGQFKLTQRELSRVRS